MFSSVDILYVENDLEGNAIFVFRQLLMCQYLNCDDCAMYTLFIQYF